MTILFSRISSIGLAKHYLLLFDLKLFKSSSAILKHETYSRHRRHRAIEIVKDAAGTHKKEFGFCCKALN